MRLIERTTATHLRLSAWLGSSVLLATTLAGPAFAQRTEGRLEDGVLNLRVEDESDPLFFAIEKLSDLCRCPISFEEPEWSGADVEVIRYPNGTRDMKVVTRGTLHVVLKVGDLAGRDWVEGVLQDLLAQHRASGSMAQFQVEPGPPVTVRPRGVSGATTEGARTLLDTEVSLAAETMPRYRWVDKLALEIGRVSGRTVRILYPPQAPALGQPVTLGVKGESARSVLRRLFAESSADVAWLASHSPAMDIYAIKLKFFPREP